MQEIVTVISTCGFPIAISLCLMWFIKYILDNHREESKEFTNALNNNTLALQKLCERLETEKES